MAKTVLENCDNVANWTSSDNTHFTKSQDTEDKQEGTGSIKVITSFSYAYSSDKCVGGTPSANNDHGVGYTAAEAFDNNESTRWLSDTETGWIQYYFPVYHIIRRVRFKPYSVARGFVPKDFNIQVYTDAWHTVYTGQHAFTENWETYSFSNSYSSRYCRINILSTWTPGDPHIEIAEIEMMTYDVVGSALNDTIIRDLGLEMAVDLTGYDRILFWIKSTRTGTYLQFGIGESAWNDNTWAVEILIADTWEQKEIDISGIADADKNAIQYLGFKCTNADSAFTFKYDDINAFKPETMEFLDSGIGTEIPLADKPITFTDSGTGVDSFYTYLMKIFEDSGVGSEKLVVDRIILFTDSGSAVEVIKVDKDLIFVDSGIGTEIQLVDKIVAYLDSGVGMDKFLRDWKAVFSDSGLGVEVFSVKYPPKFLGRKIIFIRDLK